MTPQPRRSAATGGLGVRASLSTISPNSVRHRGPAGANRAAGLGDDRRDSRLRRRVRRHAAELRVRILADDVREAEGDGKRTRLILDG